jgi:hypothetical protein
MQDKLLTALVGLLLFIYSSALYTVSKQKIETIETINLQLHHDVDSLGAKVKELDIISSNQVLITATMLGEMTPDEAINKWSK